MANLWLNEVLIPNMARSLKESDFEITREDRTASGRLVVDVIAVKKRFQLAFTTITDDLANQLLDISLTSVLNFQVERRNGSIDSYWVKVRPFSRDRLIVGSIWLQQGISIELEEV